MSKLWHHPHHKPLRNFLVYLDRKHHGLTWKALADKYWLSPARAKQLYLKVDRVLRMWEAGIAAPKPGTPKGYVRLRKESENNAKGKKWRDRDLSR